MIVGVTGYAQHGKDSVAARLVNTWGYTRFAFADALKDLALVLDPRIPIIRDNGQALIIPEGYPRLSELVAQEGWEEAKQQPEVRRFLQVLGTEGCRGTFGDDVWVNALEQRLQAGSYDRVVIPDVRFLNEAAFIRSKGGVIIRVVRPNFDNGVSRDHPSEAFVNCIIPDFNIINEGTLTDLMFPVDRVAYDIEEGFV